MLTLPRIARLELIQALETVFTILVPGFSVIHLGVDLDPTERGTVGQVINFGADEQEKFVLGSAVAVFLQWLVDQLEGGNALLRDEDDGGQSLNTREPESSHFLDALGTLFAAQKQ